MISSKPAAVSGCPRRVPFSTTKTRSVDDVRGLSTSRYSATDAMLATGAHSPATVRKVGQILSKIMRGAVEAGLIARSPCEGLRLPAEPRRVMRFLTADQVATLAEAAAPKATSLIAPPPTPGCGGASWPSCGWRG